MTHNMICLQKRFHRFWDYAVQLFVKLSIPSRISFSWGPGNQFLVQGLIHMIILIIQTILVLRIVLETNLCLAAAENIILSSFSAERTLVA